MEILFYICNELKDKDMKNRIWQLEGECSDLGLFYIPGSVEDVQDKFDEAFEKFKDSDHLLNDATDWLEDRYCIERIYIKDYIFTNKL